MKTALIILAMVAMVAAGALPASAHVISKSHSTWEFTDEGARVEFRIPDQELEHIPEGVNAEDYWPAHLTLVTPGGVGRWSPAVRSLEVARNWVLYRWEITGLGDGPRTIRSDLLVGLVPQHVHLAKVIEPGGVVREKVLVSRDPAWALDEKTHPGTSLGGYFVLGVDHILRGWDHLAFVAALIMLVGSFRQVIRLVTGFTIAHSLTLGLAALGLLRPDTGPVEILIGFSIALVAAENCWLTGGRSPQVSRFLAGSLMTAGLVTMVWAGRLGPWAWVGLALFTWCHFQLLDLTGRTRFLRAAVAFGFGLVHGFGFGGALLDIGLPSDRIVPALFGFNVGVEVGQLMVVAVLFPLLKLAARKSESVGRRVVEFGSTGIFAVGVYWLVTRNWWPGM